MGRVCEWHYDRSRSAALVFRARGRGHDAPSKLPGAPGSASGDKHPKRFGVSRKLAAELVARGDHACVDPT